MKRFIFFCISIVLFLSVFSSTTNAGWVNGYYRRDGIYVQGYWRSDPNGLKYDNYSWSWNEPWYNNSYYDFGRSYNWYKPSWEWQDDYWQGLNYYDDYNDYNGWWDW